MTKRVAIIGGGPIGIEAALELTTRGFDVTVYERGASVGASVAKWGHVRFFSPWKLNRSELGTRLLAAAGHELPDDDEFPTGAEYLRTYLRPLTELDALAGKIETLTDVRAVTRRDAWKGELIGDPQRDRGPFLLATSSPDVEEWVEADVVLDASGVYGQPGRLGPGGVSALREAAFDDRIERWIPDVLGRVRSAYANRRVLVVGAGHSASTTLWLLAKLREGEPETEVLWVLKGDTPPYVEIPDDPLPQRLELARFGNRAARGEVEGIEPIFEARILALEEADEAGAITLRKLSWQPPGIAVMLSTPAGERQKTVDRIVSNVGYRPDTEITRELQVHHCYASEGPMKLAASLLAQSGNADCLAQEAAGVDLLRTPEPNFFVIGNKSYGRNSNFLLRIGLEQIAAIADVI